MKVRTGFVREEYIPWDPQEKLRIAVMYQVASYWPSIESFYQACMENPKVDVRVFYINDMSVERVQVEGSDEFLKSEGIPFNIYSENGIKVYQPHVALYQPPYDVSYRNPSALSLHLKSMGIRIVYIPYGIEIADTEDAHFNHFFTYVIRNSWRIYTFSEAMRRDYLMYCPNRHAVRALGVPKFDAAFYKNIVPNEEMIEYARGRKIILWKLHFPKLIYEGMMRKQVTPYLDEYLKFARVIDQYDDLLFAVMPHPMFYSQTIEEKLSKEAETLFRFLETKENVWIDRGSDYRKTLYFSSAIIIDRSAIMVEAGLCGVPVLYMKNSDYEEPLTEAIASLVNVYEQGTTAKDMQKFVEAFRQDDLSVVSDRINTVKNAVFPFIDGKCGERILEDIQQGVQEPVKKTVDIIFFGASFICRHYIKELDIKNNPAVRLIGLSDNDPVKWGTVQEGLPVFSPEKLKELDFDLLVITSEQYYMPIKKKLVYGLFLDEEKIVRLDEFSEQYICQSGVSGAI